MKFQGFEQVKEIIKQNPCKDMLECARDHSKVLRRYVTGHGLTDSLEKISYFEKKEVEEIKKKLVKSTRDLFERLLQPTNRVFTAKGGIRAYGLSQSQDDAFDKILSNVRRGMSMKEWVQNVGFKAALLDPMSLVFTEQGKDGKPYPTYKSTEFIYAYICNGRQPEFVIFTLREEDIKVLIQNGIKINPEEKAIYYRVVDDAKEYIAKQIGEEITQVVAYPHKFGKVPGLIASDIPVFDSMMYESALQPVIELAAEFYNDDSSKQVFKKYQMYPREWSIELTCPRCEGEKTFKGEECTSCSGTGILAHLKPAQRISVAVNEDGKALTPTPPGGYYAPPVESWDRMNQELEALEEKITATFWGTNKVKRTTGPKVQEGNTETATGEIINERTKEPKLKDITKWAEGIDKNQTDNIKRIYYPSNNEESTIKYGDRYMHGTTEELTEYYELIKKQGAPVSMLDRALLDVYESAFDANPTELAKHKILMRVEPFVHNTVAEVINWNVAQIEKDKKMYFSEWLSTVSALDIMLMKEAGCRKALAKYVSDNVIPAEPEEDKKVA